MAEIGIACSILSCVDFGAKLSLALYEFATRLHAAPAEISRLAQDIAIFCSVLRQIDAVFDSKNDTQFSDQAITTIAEITRRCHGSLQEIQDALDAVKADSTSSKYSNEESKDEQLESTSRTQANASPTDRARRPIGIRGGVARPQTPGATFSQRMKWIFRRSKIALMRQNLGSMTMTLHLMLTTLHLSQSTECDDDKTNQGRESIELVAENLILMHEFTIKDLVEAEVTAEQEFEASTRRTRSPESKKCADPSISPPHYTETPSSSAGSAFLAKVVSCDLDSDRMSMATYTSMASVKSTLLASKWITSNRHPQNTIASSNQHAVQPVQEAPANSPTTTIKPVKGRSSSPEPPAACVSRSIQHWSNLSAYWESTVSASVAQLQVNTPSDRDPTVSQLCNQITSFSITCGGLSRALDELQKAYSDVKTDYERFLQSSVRNQEKLVGIVEKREAQVIELRNQHSIDIKRLIARVADIHAEVQNSRAELDSTKAARDHLHKELEDMKLDLQAATEEVLRLKAAIGERDTAAEQGMRELASLRGQISQRDGEKEELRQQIANEKSQRLRAIQCLTETFSEGIALESGASAIRKDSVNG